MRRRQFSREEAHRELQIIRDDLHCNAVRICGLDLDRLGFCPSRCVGRRQVAVPSRVRPGRPVTLLTSRPLRPVNLAVGRYV